MNVTYLHQPLGGDQVSLGNVLVKLLRQRSPRFRRFYVNVGFLKKAGLYHLRAAIKTFRKNRGQVHAIVGVDRHIRITTMQGIKDLLSLANSVHVFNNPDPVSPTYHPKIYILTDEKKHGVVCIGSSNVTEGGLFSNYEGNVRIDLDLQVPADRTVFLSFLNGFKQLSKSKGNSRKLSRQLLKQLEKQGYLANEERRSPPRSAATARGIPGSAKGKPLFRGRKVTRPPRRPGTKRTAPITPDIPDIATLRLDLADRFIMVLGKRDTRQIAGYSREIYVPLRAREDNPSFWGWPGKFKKRTRDEAGKRRLKSPVDERRIKVNVPTADQPLRVDPRFRIWQYPGRHEFRLNCSMLIHGAKPGDLLLLEKAKPGRPYVYEASIIPKAHHLYKTLRPKCTKLPEQSKTKFYGYA